VRDLTPQPPSPRGRGSEGERPVSESLKRHAIRPTAPQSDALARLLGERRLRELFALANGTLVATFSGAGYAAWRVYVTPDGRVQENESASEPDLAGTAEGALVIVREADRLHLGTLLPPRPREGCAPGSANGLPADLGAD
jgi:hypothetical protein